MVRAGSSSFLGQPFRGLSLPGSECNLSWLNVCCAIRCNLVATCRRAHSNCGEKPQTLVSMTLYTRPIALPDAGIASASCRLLTI
jgi:hypothetical protein